MNAGQAPLLEKIRDQIRRDGPLSVHDYMAACLGDPDHGYYRTRQAIGRGGDFVTAPEISQVFGELIGLWAVVVWQSMGSPRACRLIEIGPGRGTMMADALRAARVRPEFLAAISLSLVEPSRAMRGEQERRLANSGVGVRWHGDLTEVPADLPSILLANELLDALPVFQFVRRSGEWRERALQLTAAGSLAFCDRLPAADAARLLPNLDCFGTAAEGSVAELRDNARLAADVARLSRHPFAGLFLDYGHEAPALGDTLQAVSRHAYADPLADPGRADLTSHVDFASFAEALVAAGLSVEPLLAQGEFLGRLGIIERARALARRNPLEANAVEMAVARLVSPAAMGQRFKVLAVRGRDLAPLPGFHSEPRPARA